MDKVEMLLGYTPLLVPYLPDEVVSDDPTVEDDEDEDYDDDHYDDYQDEHPEERAEYHERIDMGRNEAGEWLGFM